jgi:hypothetical protein
MDSVCIQHYNSPINSISNFNRAYSSTPLDSIIVDQIGKNEKSLACISFLLQTVTCILIIDTAFLFFLSIYEADDNVVVNFIYPLMLCFSMILMVTFIIACQRYGKVTSGGMWITWLLYALCGLPELYYNIDLGFNPSVC